ncbi:major facilitator superfamily domain-containing protein [Microdochium bolleyi]|uniref:Major facilitator superfamily domain-containing protein n=1 Tax=Microdochium bolleyi TaxID=196109 RepID=A0A136J2T2_9PEZI|nr:major facilitator superfamily domain-containing protein [Microdochium bolleyi]
MQPENAVRHAAGGETEPLLGGARGRAGTEQRQPPPSPAPIEDHPGSYHRADSATSETNPGGRGTVNLLSAIMFVTTGSAGFFLLPHTRILEDILCHDYYGIAEAPIDELLCKVDPVQSQLTAIVGLKEGLEALVSLFAALPWGIAADRIGRRPVFALTLAGLILNSVWVTAVFWFHPILPVRLMLFGSASPLLGGGGAVLIGVLFSMVTDVTTEADRSLCFLRVHVASMCGFLLSPTLSSLMMERTGTPWYNILVGCGLLCLGASAIFFVPETLHQSKEPPSPTSPADSVTIDAQNPPEEDDDKPLAAGGRLLQHVLSQARQRLADSLAILRARSLILLLLVCLAYMPVLNSTVSLMTPFMSRRYGITIARTGYVQTAYGVMQIVQSLVVLPWIMRRIAVVPREEEVGSRDRHNNNTNNTAGGDVAAIASPCKHQRTYTSSSSWLPSFRSNPHRDLVLAKLSFLLLLLGSVTLALAPTLAIFILGLALLALGTGYASLTRSLMALYVPDPAHTSRLFSVTGMVETLGGVYASPLLSALFALGMRLGGGWIGLPWLGVAGFMALCIALLMAIRLPGDEGSGGHEDDETGGGGGGEQHGRRSGESLL